MVVLAATDGALGRPTTDGAVIDRVGVRAERRERGRIVSGHRRQEPSADAAVVSHEVVDAEAFDRPGATSKGDVHPFGIHPLDGDEQVHVGADLEDGAGLDMPGELRVGDLVVPWPERRRSRRVVDAQEEVGVATPPPIEERRLVDDIRPRDHRRHGLCGRGSQPFPVVLDRAVETDSHGGPTLDSKVRQEPPLVLEAALPDDVQLRVVAHRPLDEPRQRRAFELCQVLTGQIGNEIGGRVHGAAVDELHEPTLPADRVTSPVTAWAEATRDSHRFRPRPPRSNALGDGPRTVVTEFNRIPNKGDRALHHHDRVRRA